MIAKKVVKIGIGKGRSVPPSNAPKETREQKGDRRYVEVGTSVDVPPPITMKLDPQGPPVSYAEAASRPPQTGRLSPRTPCTYVRHPDEGCT